MKNSMRTQRGSWAGSRRGRHRQNFIKKVYGNFFKSAYKKGTEKHGIVYTPVEVIDFMIRSVDEVLRGQFGRGFGRQVRRGVGSVHRGPARSSPGSLESGLIDEQPV